MQMSDVPARWYEVQLYRVAVPPEVVFRDLSGETVLLNIKTGQYFGLDQVGGTFFEVMQRAPDVGTACKELAAFFEQPVKRIRADFIAFAEALEERGLIELAGP